MSFEKYMIISPVNTTGEEYLKLILLPLGGNIVKYMHDEDKALICFKLYKETESIEIPGFTLFETEEIPEKNEINNNNEEINESELFTSTDAINTPANSKDDSSNQKASQSETFPSDSSKGIHKISSNKIPLKQNDIFYLLMDLNVLVPVFCIFMILFCLLAIWNN